MADSDNSVPWFDATISMFSSKKYQERHHQHEKEEFRRERELELAQLGGKGSAKALESMDDEEIDHAINDYFRKKKKLKQSNPFMEQHKRLHKKDTMWNAAMEGTPADFEIASQGDRKRVIHARGIHFRESLLHIACLFSNRSVALHLVKYYPELINKRYSDVFAGETALHIAIVQGDVELTKALLCHQDFAEEKLFGNSNVTEIRDPIKKTTIDRPNERGEYIKEEIMEEVTHNETRTNGTDHISVTKETTVKISITNQNGGTKTETRKSVVELKELKYPVKSFLDSPYIPNQSIIGKKFIPPEAPIPLPPTPSASRSGLLYRPTKANVATRVTGEFFDKNNPQGVYFGDHPLAFAVCLKAPQRKEIIRLLIHHGARLDVKDRHGNNLLHLCVYHDDLEMYNYVLDLFNLYKRKMMKDVNDYIKLKKTRLKAKIEMETDPKKKRMLQEQHDHAFHDEIEKETDPIARRKLLEQKEKDFDLEKMYNSNKRTPFTYAVALGKDHMIKAILERRKKLMWIYGPVASYAYPLKEIDTMKKHRKDPSTALMLAVYLEPVKGIDRKQILQLTPFKEILDEKWNQFAKYVFFFMFVSYLIFLLLVVFAVARPNILMVEDPDQLGVYVRGPFIHTCEIIIEIFVFNMVLQELMDIFTLRKRYFTEQGSRFFYLINWISCLLFISAIPLRIYGLSHSEDMVVGAASIFAFLYLMYFARGEKHIGYLVVILRNMILGDVVRFIAIFLIIFLGFSLAFIEVFRNDVIDGFGSYPWTLYSLFGLTILNFNSMLVEDASSLGFAVLLTIVYCVFTGIILINLLIAMMNFTFMSILEKSESQWKMEWASIILFVERRIPDALRNRSKRLQTGEPGKELGFPDDEEFYLVALEKVPWNLSTNKKNYRSILRRAIKLVYYQVLFWKFKKPKTSEEKPVGEEEEEEEDEENNISKKRPSRIAEEKKGE